MTIILGIAGGMLLAAGLMVLYRTLRGPSNLDRALAADVMVVLVTSTAALYIAATKDAASLPILAVVALTGFVGSVSVARFMAKRAGGR